MKSTVYKIVVLVVVVAGIVGVIIFNNSSKEKPNKPPAAISHTNQEKQKLPQLMEFGRGKCQACKDMEPILKELTIVYKEKVVIKSVNIGDESDEAEKYGIKLIPTQIFFDKDDNEVWRHEGFLPKEEIIAKFKEMGVK